MKLDFKALTEKTSRLPSPPGVATKIVELARRRDVEIQEVIDVISRDPALSSKILRFANSPIYSQQKEVESLRRALVVMGLNAAINLALSFSLLDSMKEQQGQSLDYTLFWKRSILAATAARELGAAIGELALEELFLAGLLQNIGMLVIDRVYPDFYAELGSDQAHEDRVAAYEKKQCTMEHAELGGWLLHKWSLAERTELAVAASHNPDTYSSGHSLSRFCRCVALSGPIADLFITEDSENLYEKLTKDAQEYLGIESSLLDDILLKFSQMVPELEALFDIDLHQCHMPSGILEQANEALMLRNLETFRLADKRQSSSSIKQELIEQKEDDSAVDPLTGLFSKQFLEHYLQEIFQRCERTGMSMSMALAVLDNFDPISKKHGRPICDDILTETAQLLEGAVRAGDVIARYGDEVFAIALPGVNTVTANEICKRFANTRKSLSHRIKLGRSLPVTLSMAVVTHNDGIKFVDSNSFMEAVNSTLYKAKLEGSNSLLQYTAEAAATLK